MTASKGSATARADHYTAQDITVLKGLDPVRQRPGMYIGSTGTRGLHHLVYEVVDNAVDEAMANHCDRIIVELLADGGCRVSDNGRGIPVDNVKGEGRTAVEVVLTTLHAGGKFGGKGYQVSGGLHGVGVSVVNALSEKLIVDVARDGKLHHQEYERGKPQAKLKAVKSIKRTGTTITFWPDPLVFTDDIEFKFDTLAQRLREMAFLTKGLEIRLIDQRVEPEAKEEFRYTGGIVDFVKHLNSARDALFKRVVYLEAKAENHELEIAMQWTSSFNESVFTFANNINTHEGGMHEEGFRRSLTRVIGNYAKAKGMLKEKDPPLTGDDCREGLTAIISVKLRDPQFEGQTKTKLGNTEIRSFVETSMNQLFGEFMEEHPSEARAICNKVITAQRARLEARKARDLVRRKSLLESTALPGKLADCQTRDPHEAEIFIVEGDSAGGSAKQARARETQAILPLRGKILNVERARLAKTLENKEIQAIITAIGTGIGEDFDPSKCRYHKIVCMADADVDGSHIKTLLLTLFFRHMFQLIELGYIYVAKPPLYRVKHKGKNHYFMNDEELNRYRAESSGKVEAARFKGLGEMNPDELWETTLNPSNRTLMRVTMEDAAIADALFDQLMGEDVEERKNFIQRNAKDVRFLDI
ncbi:MAG: DNA topoisomerase (ATP-hydrolyzing) subunit B [Actinobacteria bacterium]|jgi:DNA gyrase subunit B|nr:DNA topoisomerase (ATP-hydrolyzing) subunit B [Actinomycetota bacterium]